MHDNPLTRRQLVTGASAAALGAALSPATLGAPHNRGEILRPGKLKQSVARWCFGRVKLPDLCKAGKEMGLAAIDLLHEREWSVAHDHGLEVSTGFVGAGTIPHGLNDPKHHKTILDAFEKNIPKAAKNRVRNVICFFGNRVTGMSDAKAAQNSIDCLNKCKAIAEEHKVTILVELLNSKVDHKGYVGDNSKYCVEVIRGANSDYVKVLYDIYHAQIMEGDVIRTIRNNHKWFGHYHTGGNPGRNEIDETQELYYPAIAKAVLATGFDGYFAHEFIPRQKVPLDSLRKAVRLCDVG
ncbi:MAG: TIM barrel protein [Planctomycetes bacterium]|nr:TIM barrel protein [Planctomycetota bacterium]